MHHRSFEQMSQFMKNHHNNETTTIINKCAADGSTAVVYDVLCLECSLFWSVKPERERREAGVGFAIKRNIVTKLTQMSRPVSDRIMTMILPLSMQQLSACTFQQYQTQMKTRMPSTTTWKVCSEASLVQISYCSSSIRG